MTKQKTQNLNDFFVRAAQFIRLEAADAELALAAQAEVGPPVQSLAEAKPDNNGKRKANAGGEGNGNGKGKQKRFKGAGRYGAYTDLTDTIKNIYLATQAMMPYKKPPAKQSTEKQR